MVQRTALPFELSVTPGRGASASLRNQLRNAILEGRLAVGFRLPPTRELARSLGLARTTVVLVYEMLVAEGYASVRHGDGTFVQSLRRVPKRTNENLPSSSRAAKPPSTTPRFDLRLGSPDISSFPFDIWRRMAAKAWKTSAGVGYGNNDPAGVAILRQLIVGHASFARAVSCNADDIVITSGAQQAFDLLARTLVRSGTCVAVEDPGYPAMRAAFSAAGARVFATPVDEGGLIVDRLPPGVKVICVTPSHQFPVGVAMSAARRLALLDYARANDSIIIEDDYDCEYRYDSRPLDALQILAPERVCYVATFSKTMFPSLRLGYAIVPFHLRSRLLEIRCFADGFAAPAPQLALAHFIEGGHLHRHVRRMQRIYSQRRDELLTRLTHDLQGRIEIFPAKAGLHFSFRTLQPMIWDDVVKRASDLDITFERCSHYGLSTQFQDSWAISFGLIPDHCVSTVAENLTALLS